MKNPFVQMLIGVLAGLVVPLVFGWLFLRNLYEGELTLDVVFLLMKSTSLIMKLLFVAILPNMFAVFMLNYFELWNYCRGVFVSIMLYIAVAVII
jgi:hypothetical protein